MIRPDQIPDEVVEAAARAVLRAVIYDIEPDVRANGMTDDEYQIIAEAALRAGLKAWPDMERHVTWPYEKLSHIILPLPQEDGDE